MSRYARRKVQILSQLLGRDLTPEQEARFANARNEIECDQIARSMLMVPFAEQPKTGVWCGDIRC